MQHARAATLPPVAREAFAAALGVGSLLLPEPQSTQHRGREALLQ